MVGQVLAGMRVAHRNEIKSTPLASMAARRAARRSGTVFMLIKSLLSYICRKNVRRRCRFLLYHSSARIAIAAWFLSCCWR